MNASYMEVHVHNSHNSSHIALAYYCKVYTRKWPGLHGGKYSPIIVSAERTSGLGMTLHPCHMLMLGKEVIVRSISDVRMYVCMYVCICVCICVCMKSSQRSLVK